MGCSPDGGWPVTLEATVKPAHTATYVIHTCLPACLPAGLPACLACLSSVSTFHRHNIRPDSLPSLRGVERARRMLLRTVAVPAVLLARAISRR